jgi:DNA-binding transcriptional LysR family regulator
LSVSTSVFEGTRKDLLTRYAAEGSPISIVYPASRFIPQRVRALIDFLERITRVKPRKSVGKTSAAGYSANRFA